MSAKLFARRALINTLRQDSTIQTLSAWNGGYKVFGGDYVPEEVPHPFIVVRYFTGGHDYSGFQSAIDVQMLVVAEVEVAEDVTASTTAETWAEAIYGALQEQKPVLPASLSSLYNTNHRIREMFPFEEKYMRQNRHYLQRGGVYYIHLDPK